jgi:hypothetical protein
MKTTTVKNARLYWAPVPPQGVYTGPMLTTQPPAPPLANPEPTSDDSVPSCPNADGTTFTDTASGSRFKWSCNVQHPGYDLEHYEADSMTACVALCAKNEDCKGVTWYNAGPQGEDLNYCWLKNNMEGETRSTSDAQSAERL